MELTSISLLTLVGRNSRPNCLLKQELRRYEPRSRFPKKSPFRAHFRAFYPHPAHKSALRAEVGHPLLGTRETWLVPNVPWPLFSRLTPHASRPTPPTPDQRGQVVRRPSPAGYCLPPTAELAKTERGPIATSGPPISVCHQTGRFLRTNQSVLSAPGRVRR